MSLFSSDDLNTGTAVLKPAERIKVKLTSVEIAEKDGKKDLVFKFKGLDPSNNGVFQERFWNNKLDPDSQRDNDPDKFLESAKRVGSQILHIVHAYVPTMKDANGVDVPVKIDADTKDAFGYGNDFYQKVVNILTPETYKDVPAELKLVVSSYNNKTQLPLWDFLSTDKRPIQLKTTAKDSYEFKTEDLSQSASASPFAAAPGTPPTPPSPNNAELPSAPAAPAFGQQG